MTAAGKPSRETESGNAAETAGTAKKAPEKTASGAGGTRLKPILRDNAVNVNLIG